MKRVREWQVGARQSAALARFTDPLSMCVMTVTGLLLLAIVCAAYVLWNPLALVALIVAVGLAPGVHRATKNFLFRFRAGQRPRRLYLGLVGIAAIASVPFSMAFLQTDLRALSATATANAMWQGPDTDEKVLENLYGATPSWPSYGTCQTLQNAIGRDLANSCYSGIGYVRSWQIPTAIPVMLCLTALYCGIPLFVARQVRTSHDADRLAHIGTRNK